MAAIVSLTTAFCHIRIGFSFCPMALPPVLRRAASDRALNEALFECRWCDIAVSVGKGCSYAGVSLSGEIARRERAGGERVSAYLDVFADESRTSVVLDGDRLSIGRGAGNDLVLADDKVSRVHAVLERVGPTWSVRDLSSSNGTFLNGTRLTKETPLDAGDEIVVGRSRLVVRGAAGTAERPTAGEVREPIPDLTRRERDVLEALCRPLLSGGYLPEPATTKEVAEELVVTEAAVRQHLLHLYDKFGIYGDESRRRVQLAREAILRGAVGHA